VLKVRRDETMISLEILDDEDILKSSPNYEDFDKVFKGKKNLHSYIRHHSKEQQLQSVHIYTWMLSYFQA
jgi:hypothetical protein